MTALPYSQHILHCTWDLMKRFNLVHKTFLCKDLFLTCAYKQIKKFCGIQQYFFTSKADAGENKIHWWRPCVNVFTREKNKLGGRNREMKNKTCRSKLVYSINTYDLTSLPSSHTQIRT